MDDQTIDFELTAGTFELLCLLYRIRAELAEQFPQITRAEEHRLLEACYGIARMTGRHPRDVWAEVGLP
jgi:hypothetical protein